MSDQATDAEADPYEQIARWYDIEHDEFDEDVRFYLDIAAGAGPHVLEIGCGTGRIAVALGRGGRHVTGVDRSAAMLARARARLVAEAPDVRARVTLHHGDARLLADMVRGQFSLAIIPLNTLAHFVTYAERLALLRALRDCLVPGGRLVVDVDTQGPRRLVEAPGQLWLQGVWPVENDDTTEPDSGNVVSVCHLICGAAAEPDVVLVTHLYDALERSGIVRRSLSQMRMALLTRGEVEAGLEHAGFAVESVYGTYDLDPYQTNADRAIVIAHSQPDA